MTGGYEAIGSIYRTRDGDERGRVATASQSVHWLGARDRTPVGCAGCLESCLVAVVLFDPHCLGDGVGLAGGALFRST